jgi:DNA-binding XRE family transcriptional regulator
MSDRGHIGTNLRHLLGMHDLQQGQLATYVGLSPQGMWNILNGRSQPRMSTAHALATAFGVRIDDLFTATGDCVRAAADVFERAPVRTATGGEAPSAPNGAGANGAHPAHGTSADGSGARPPTAAPLY